MSLFDSQKVKQANILMLMSGSIACEKASAMIARWTESGYRVRVARTRSVSHFVSEERLKDFGAEQVVNDLFAAGGEMEHISLGKWADIIIVAPATSNLINKFASGVADELVSTLWQAAYGLGKPMVIAPAMNTRMWRYPATRESVAKLKEWGIHVLPVESGELACGERGEGRLLEPEQIIQTVEQLLNVDRAVEGKRILVTGGGTREPIDSVRFIGNRSSGLTASVLANELSRAGHRVTWLGANNAIRPETTVEMELFETFDDLKQQLQRLLHERLYDMVIHAAAVGDFSVDTVEYSCGGAMPVNGGKLSSATDLALRLKRNPKLLNHLKTWSRNPDVRVIGFKLTDTADEELRLAAIHAQLENHLIDAVVHNDLSEIQETRHVFRLHKRGKLPRECASKRELALTIDQLLRTAA